MISNGYHVVFTAEPFSSSAYRLLVHLEPVASDSNVSHHSQVILANTYSISVGLFQQDTQGSRIRTLMESHGTL
jgi:hypothetical protein